MHGTGAPLGRYSREVPGDAVVAAARVAAVLEKAERVLILGHAGADGDVCGSSLGLAMALRERGKDVVVYNEEPYPEAYAWLPGASTLKTSLSQDERWDATVVVDAARPDRLGKDFPGAARRGTWVWIDHHRIAEAPGDVAYVDLTAAAVGEQIAQILDALEHPISGDVARCLYASLLADTGGFRYGNTSARAFQLAARLVDAGVEPWEMTERIYESQEESRVRLLGKALGSLWVSPCGRVGVVELRADDLLTLNAGEHHMHGIVNHVRGIRGVEVAILLYETPSETRVTIRSRGNVSVAPVAASLGALGHKNAANFHLDKPLDDSKALVVDAFLSALPRVEPGRPLGRAPDVEEKSEKRRAAARARHLRPAE